MSGILRSNIRVLRTFIHLLDPLVIGGGTWLMYRYFSPYGFGPSELARILGIYGSVLALLIFPLFRIYRSWRGQSIAYELQVLLEAWGCTIILFNAIVLLLATKEQLQVLWPYGLFMIKTFWVWAGGCFSLMALYRSIARLFFRFMRWRGYNQRHAVLVGAGALGRKTAQYFMNNPWLGINPLCFFDDREDLQQQTIPFDPLPGLQVLGAVNDVIAYCGHVRPDMVIITLPMRAEKKINDIVWSLGTSGISIFLIPDLFAYGLQKARLHQLGEIPIMSFNLFPTWKRAFDIIFSSAVLLLTSPLFLIIALLIKLEDKGPIFYGHKRIKESGGMFGCLKFRTMHRDADKRLQGLLASDARLREEWQKSFKLKKDPRITRVGYFLRKSSLDELPQFLNVLRGEMSIVGARPIVAEELSNYYKEVAITYCAMKPGITGPWQVGKRNDVDDYAERVELDRNYILNASLLLDLKIIVKTVLKMISMKGAY